MTAPDYTTRPEQRPQRAASGKKVSAAAAATEYLLGNLERQGTPALNIPQAIADGRLTDDQWLETVQEFKELHAKHGKGRR